MEDEAMTPEADCILGVFKARGLRVGTSIHPAEFGDAIIWSEGYIRDEPVRKALAFLFDAGYLIEHAAAFELSRHGDAYLYSNSEPKRGHQ
jgi:hypothetical protein